MPKLVPKKRKPRVDPEEASTSGTSIEVPGASPEPVVIEPTLGGKFPKTVPVGVPLDVSETQNLFSPTSDPVRKAESAQVKAMAGTLLKKHGFVAD